MQHEDLPPFEQVPGEDVVDGQEYHIDLTGGGPGITVVGGGEPLAPETNSTPIVDVLPKQYGNGAAAEASPQTREVVGPGGTVRQLGLAAVRRAAEQSSDPSLQAFTEERRRLRR